MNSTPWPLIVKAKSPLFLDAPDGKPVLLDQTGNSFELAGTDLDAWLLRTSLSGLKASPAGRAWFAEHNPLNVPVPAELRLAPREYQKLGMFRMLASSCNLWWDMGLGKCYMCLWYALLRFQKSPNSSVYLIICPVSIFGTWQNQIEEHLTIKPRVVLAHGPKKAARLAELRTSLGELTFVFTTYETLGNVLEALKECPLGAVFFDECSRARHMDTKRTQHCHALVNRERKDVPRFGLSGTPSTTSVEGYFSLYELLGYGKSGCKNIAHWKNKYIESELFFIAKLPDGQERHIHAGTSAEWLLRNRVPGSAHTYYLMGYSFSERPTYEKHIPILRFYNKAVGTKNLDQLTEITRLNAYCLKKEDVLPQLPGKTRLDRLISMTEKQAKAYREMAESCRTEIEGKPVSFTQKNSPFAKLHQLANGYILDSNGEMLALDSQPKLDELEILIEEAGDEKCIIWSPFVKQLEQVIALLTRREAKFLHLYGATTPEQRRTAEKRFRDECQFMVANPSVAGLGMNLAFSHLQVFMTNWFAPDIRAQAEDRQNRSGQTSPVTIVDLIMRGTVERKILNDLIKKIALEGQILSMSDIMGETCAA